MGIVQFFLGLLLKMSGFKFTFEDWNDIYKKSTSGSRRQKVALENMFRLAMTEEEWTIVYDLANPDSKIFQIARDELSRIRCRDFVSRQQKRE